VHVDRPCQIAVPIVFNHSLTSAGAVKHMSPLVTYLNGHDACYKV